MDQKPVTLQGSLVVRCFWAMDWIGSGEFEWKELGWLENDILWIISCLESHEKDRTERYKRAYLHPRLYIQRGTASRLLQTQHYPSKSTSLPTSSEVSQFVYYLEERFKLPLLSLFLTYLLSVDSLVR